ncbi:octaprenyl-diphosphate synthase [Amycolatopsis sp. WAC 01416]|uniref:polyprenyl synthetase family protein n=1 Tax=Amycolatopsis sp. WAC 01416 TaxID=2203196 RepID=UPI000F791DB4|nr:polyprenyl synthetase family protein [Amycolatopsis sp. WAC 01416]RSN24803.1 octaprenyl-diphosphate synthase [Amycolatopsis sp. WAC 01416]
MTFTLPRDEVFAADIRSSLAEFPNKLTPTLRPSVSILAADPGKCLRSHLVEVSSRFGERDWRRTVRLGTLVEVLHAATLLHDDIIDRAAIRRGRPSAHTVVGHESAVLAGAALLAAAGQEAAELGTGVSRLFATTVADLAHGELLDVERAFDVGFESDSYIDVARHKTSALFRLSCVLGAGAAGVDEDTVLAVAGYGAGLGVAFQIADDCMDFRTEPGNKPLGTDHLLGLFGLPTLCALRSGADDLRELLMKPDLGLADLPAIRSIVLASGGLDQAMEVARTVYRDAVTSLGDLTGTAAGAALVATGEALWRQWM